MEEEVLGASPQAAKPALVASDQAASRLALTGFDPARVRLAGCCRRCTEYAVAADGDDPMDFRLQRMFLCAVCGNKRCPHATDHRLACTGSNVSGQAGSDYGQPMLDEHGLRQLLAGLAREHGTLSAWANKKGIHPEIALSVARGTREPAKTLLATLGLRRVVAYAPLPSDSGRPPEGEDSRSEAECEAGQSGGEAASPESSQP